MSSTRSEARSHALFTRASHSLVGGVSSPVRAFKSVGGTPICMARGSGARVWDVDDNDYIDYVLSYGPLILGHAEPTLLAAIAEACARGTTFGATVLGEVQLAERVKQLVPSIDKVRFVSSGTEATMSALRLARGATQRNKVIKFAGGYHGHADAFLVDEAGSGLATMGIPGSAGVTAGATQDTLTVPYNDLSAARAIAHANRADLAAIIVEPIACNMGMVQPHSAFLPGLRALCDELGALLIFDEVITGFRVAAGGAQSLFGIHADLCTYGKILGGGLPVGAYGGRAALMDYVAPLGPVYQAGTLSGNPVAMAAGLSVLSRLAPTDVSAMDAYTRLEQMGAHMQEGLQKILHAHGAPAQLSRVGSIFHLWGCPGADAPPRNYNDIKRADTAWYAKLFRGLLRRGVALAPSAFEVGFLSTAHTHAEIDHTLRAFDATLRSF